MKRRLKWSAVLVAVAGVVAGTLGARAATVNVVTDPGQTWNGYLNIFNNGPVDTIWPPYVSRYLGAGQTFAHQGSVDESGTVTVAPDLWADQMMPFDTSIWQDDSGTSSAIGRSVSTFYIDSTTIAASGDTVVFTGTMATNGLVAPYRDTAILFIKDYDSNWGWKGMSAVNLNTLTNGQPFSVSYGPLASSGDHIQWGVEWAGPSARLATVAALGSAVITTNSAAAPQARTVNISTDHNQRWVGYQTANLAVPYFTGYLDLGAGDIQGTISSSDLVRCAPDLRADKLAHGSTVVWQDSSGTSDAASGLAVDSVFYVDSGTLAANGDTVVFSGQLLTNTLAEPYNGSIVAFIKDFDAGWGWHGMSTLNLSTLTNGEVFSVSKTISGGGAHVQYGFEWVGPPARTNPAAASHAGNLGQILVASRLVSDVAGIVAINPSPAMVRIGDTVNLTATTTGSGLKYQWGKDGVPLVNGDGVSGVASAALILANVQGNREGTYSLTVTDSAGNADTKGVSLYVYNPAWLYYDRAFAPFNGYINVWNGTNRLTSPAQSGGEGTRPKANFGFAVAPPTGLRASVNTNNDVVTLQPNTYVYDNALGAMDPNYINADGSAAAYVEQDYYIQNNVLAGNTLVFAGFCPSNSLDPAYTARAWIKMSKDWSTEYRYDTNLVAGKPFILTVPASATTGQNYVQYGFAIWGPANSSTNPATRGAVEVKVYSPLAGSKSAGVMNLTFPTVMNHDYAVQYKTNLTDPAWVDMGTNKGTGNTVTVPDSTGGGRRFYRLRTQ